MKNLIMKIKNNFIFDIKVYLLLNFGDISKFFTTYVANNYKTFEVTVAGTYITLITYLAIIVLILSNAIIFLLMRSKKKSTLTD